MRRYEDKQNAQKRVYNQDRFFVTPTLPKEEVGGEFLKDVEELKKNLHVKEAYVEAGQLVVWVEPENNFKALEVMQKLGYEMLSELSAVDFIAQKGGFEVFYQLLSIVHVRRARVKCFVEQNQSLQSIEALFKSANWAEREMYDMFGILLINHPYMKRILMPDDWSGHPLLKSYPLHGDESAQWYEIDTIFGKEYRDVVGAEQRDSARIDIEDTENFARIRHEVGYGEPYSSVPTTQEYQEEGGVAVVTKVTKKDSKMIEGRR